MMHSSLDFSIPNVSLDAAGLVALADLKTAARRVALTGTASLLDTLVICPGLHRVFDAQTLNGNEFPACAAMTTGYVFRVENPATVAYLQKVGRTGHLTTLRVEQVKQLGSMIRLVSKFYNIDGLEPAPTVAYFVAVALNIVILALLALLGDWWALSVVLILCSARCMNALIIRSCAQTNWQGASEKGKSDLLVLLSYDRWIRIKGAIDDVKAVTSGEWLKEPSFVESSFVAFATLLVYLDAALAGNATQAGKLLLMVLLFGSAGLLGLANQWTTSLNMKGRVLTMTGEREFYRRRKDLADELIKQSGRDDWAVGVGMVVPGNDRDIKSKQNGAAVM